jgi:hypothetical protein
MVSSRALRSEPEADRAPQRLLAYRRRDTEVMVRLLERLREMAGFW